MMNDGKFGWLRILNPPTGCQDRFALRNEKSKSNAIGRRAKISPPDVNILLDTKDNSISRRHCSIKISMRDARYVYLLSDLGSKTGTLIYKRQNNQHQLKIVEGDQVYISDQDIIQVGSLRMQIELPIE